MNLAQFSVKNSLFVNLLSAFIVVGGIFSFSHLRREAFPQVEYDIVTVSTIYPGAPPEDVEKLITIPLEEEIRSVSGIEKITSKSEEGSSTIGIYLDPAVSDKDEVVNDIRRAVDRVKTLPEEAEDPLVVELTTREMPILEISLNGDVPESVRRRYAESLEDKILDIDGVASVRRVGWRDREFQVEVDPEKSREFHVSIEEIMEALKTRNITIPAGQLTTANVEFNVRASGEFANAAEIAEVIIRANDAGNWLKVKDVARVLDTFEDAVHLSKVNGREAAAMVVIQREKGDAINIVRDIKEELKRFQEYLPPEITVAVTNDLSYYIQRRLNVLVNNGIIGFILVVLILFLFLDHVPALMTALGIPVALLGTFWVMSMMGLTINLVTMLGLIIVLGMLVDDGIIISENVYRYIEMGVLPREAAVKGASEVMIPVTATIVTTLAAFAPLLYMPDMIGKFVRFIPMVVIIALTVSLFEAFVVLPSHLADFVRSIHHSRIDGKEHHPKTWFHVIIAVYTKSLKAALRHRYLVLGGMAVAFAAAIALVFSGTVRTVLFAGEGIEYFYVRAQAPQGTPLEKMNELIVPVEKLIAGLDQKELDSYRTYLGSIEQERGFDPDARSGTHLAQITVFLTPLQKRDRAPQEIVDSLRPRLKEIEGFDKLYFFMPKEGPPTGRPVEVAVKGEDFDTLQKLAARFKEYLEKVPGVSDVTTSYDLGKKQLIVKIDEEKAKTCGLSVGRIAASVRHAFQGGVATTVKPSQAEEETDVVVRFPKEDRDSLKAFDKILIPNPSNQLIPLEAVARVEPADGIYKISHLDGKRVIYVTAQVDDRSATSLSVNRELQKQFKGIEKEHLGYTARYSGEFEDQQKTFRGLLQSFLIAFFSIFIILVAMFRSLIQPFIVMATIPLGIVGVIFAFWAHGCPLSFFAFMGLVGLAGVVVNDSIVLVDFINRLRAEGKEKKTSIIEACRVRLRPILMTTITTVAGLVSVAYGIGGGDPFLKPMALTIVWGLGCSTVLTLIVIPCLYAVVDDLHAYAFSQFSRRNA